ncbi:MAG TPA: isoprenylcysteine carboxylmethyltransferase family protein, partial [Anaerolineales bacterium]|nr:isoprenylcysteine carboxylmethyltransferase family protein [Anaerolineales bacterium]
MKQQLTRDGFKTILMPFGWKALFFICFFLAAGRMDIPRAWFFLGMDYLGAIVVSVVFWKLAPELANQRATIKEGTKPWDKVFLVFYFTISLIAFPIIAGLDVGRYHWSELHINYAITGILLFVMCYAFGSWAIVVNQFFETTVRIQKDRGHHVITNGPYHFVRHPGYLSMIIGALSASMIIGSLYSLIPGGLGIIAVVIRTYLEDRTLKEELEG